MSLRDLIILRKVAIIDIEIEALQKSGSASADNLNQLHALLKQREDLLASQ
jgi:hypothetical protein